MASWQIPVVSIFASLMLGGCETEPERQFIPISDFVPIEKVQIASRFDRVNISLENLDAEIEKCVPLINKSSREILKFRKEFPSNNTVAFGDSNSSKTFIVHETTAICLHKSSRDFPIFAAEALDETINPKGVPPDISDSWNKQIALLIATKGTAKVAYVFRNGQAIIASYSADSKTSFIVSYSHAFNPPGTWETDSFDAKFSHPKMIAVSEIRRSGSNNKVIH